MAIIGFIVCVLIIVLLQALYQDLHNSSTKYNTTIDGNMTLANLISDSILETWVANAPEPTKAKMAKIKPEKSFVSDDEKNATNLSTSLMVIAPTVENLIKDESEARGSPTVEIQGDDASIATTLSFDSFVESLFDPPLEEVDPDWSNVLGTFSHYDDENWKEFLIKTEVPIIVRMFLADSFRKRSKFHENLTRRKKILSKLIMFAPVFSGKKNLNPKLISPSDFEMSIETTSWILTHESKFRLGDVVIEHDLDGTDSKNTFFFSNPRLLIHNKIKNKWRTAIVRHFDETGLNMTFVDRDRLLMARRFFKRIS
ncbi:hypothetical protein Anas_04021 [Armadillidium nasatum]|uniref:Uncharacterized protein n=1 Tax=Armadillidium nasatum TaxID=96803 RepID=A0A5N5T550_9CRUS|nr:hypothetical protein Anas_04021 [Armadillidium nasatum]